MKKTVIMDIDKTIERIERTAKLEAEKVLVIIAEYSLLHSSLDNIYLILKKKIRLLVDCG